MEHGRPSDTKRHERKAVHQQSPDENKAIQYQTGLCRVFGGAPYQDAKERGRDVQSANGLQRV